jgi:hypothetical protein
VKDFAVVVQFEFPLVDSSQNALRIVRESTEDK